MFLVHSGFSVVVKPPTIAQFIALERKIADGQKEFGREIGCLLGTHGNTLIVKAIMDMFFECLVRTSIGTLDREILANNISYMDVGTIAWLLACSKYPNGYQIYLPCVAKNNGCNHVWNEMMNIKQFYFVDNSRLTEKQMKLASAKYDTMTEAEVTEYLDEFDFSEWNTIEIDDEEADFIVYIDLAQPTLAQTYVASGEWMASLEQSANQAFARALMGKERDAYINEMRAVSWALNYVQYVEKIRVVNRDEPSAVEIVESRDQINSLISDLTANVEYYGKYISAMRRFISMSTCVVVGIPNLKCPSCGGIHEIDEEDQLHKHLIPMDPIGLFSHLCQQFVLPYKAAPEDQSRTSTQP